MEVLQRWYAIDEMIRALPALIHYRPDTKMLVVGGSLFTDYQATLYALAKDLGVSDHVIFTANKP